MSDKPGIVLVHGAWADGSSWSAVIESLQADGYTVSAPQFPETSLADDVARLRQVLRRGTGPAVVVGHSYGGQIMTALGPDSAGVAALVYIAAFGLDEGESLGALLGGGAPTQALGHLIVDERGFAWIPEEDFVGHFAADVDPVKAKVMCAVQQGLSMSTFEDVMGVPAWKSHPSCYLVATNDEAIPPDAERMFAQRMRARTVEVAASHVAMVSHPIEVVDLIKAAAEEVGAAAGHANVKERVSGDAFEPAAGETLQQLTFARPGSCLAGGGDLKNVFNFAVDPSQPSGDPDLYLKIAPGTSYAGFNACFATFVPEDDADVLGAVQRPLALGSFTTGSGTPAWATIPSWP